MSQQTPLDRLQYAGPLDPLVQRICDSYQLGDLLTFSVITIGYEDCNVLIQTRHGRYVAKIFGQQRTVADIERYRLIMEQVVTAGVRHPLLTPLSDGSFLFHDVETKLSLVVMSFIEGKTFLELDRAPDAEEHKQVIEQAALIHSIPLRPPVLFDSWAIPHIQSMQERVQQFIQPDDLTLIQEAIKRFKAIPLDRLPHCFVHGDLIKTNLIKGSDGKIYAIDFSVSNHYPRIQELAVIVANLMHDQKNPRSLEERCHICIDEYGKYTELSDLEKSSLHDYALAGVAMEFMGAHQEKYLKGNDTDETDYWLALGREGLRQELNKT